MTQNPSLIDRFEAHGFIWLRQAVAPEDLRALDEITTDTTRPGRRVRESPALKRALTGSLSQAISQLSPEAKPVRIVNFNKNQDANWGVPWHQDRVIALRQRADIAGFGNWSQKAGIWHCEPPQHVLDQMLFVRVHLDDTDDTNGAMKIAIGSHRKGLMSDDQAARVAREHPIETCQAQRGDVLVLKMLTLHASDPATTASSRRVLRIDYASGGLPAPLTGLGPVTKCPYRVCETPQIRRHPVLNILMYLAIFGAAVVLILLYDWLILEPKRRREAEEAPRITVAELKAYWQVFEDNALPVNRAKVQNRAPTSPRESRIGGAPLAIGEDTSWPRSRHDGFPLFLIAQINFADMPQIDDFPTKGVLQIFSNLSLETELYRTESVIRWEPDPQTTDLIKIPQEILDKSRETSDFSERTRHTGLPLVFDKSTMNDSPYNWPHAYSLEDPAEQNRLPENDEAKALLDTWEDRTDQHIKERVDHWVGGHPSFVQEDLRFSHPELRPFNRVLFHLGYDDDINLGDSGEMNVIISQDALLKRDFHTAHVSWDCC